MFGKLLTPHPRSRRDTPRAPDATGDGHDLAHGGGVALCPGRAARQGHVPEAYHALGAKGFLQHGLEHVFPGLFIHDVSPKQRRTDVLHIEQEAREILDLVGQIANGLDAVHEGAPTYMGI